ncbi:MAG: hypothetical protein OXI56_09530 [bacterium]|nr:hypothetical protein [bacterium]
MPHPAVHAWALQVEFETDDGGTVETVWHTLHSGALRLVRLIDYAGAQTTNTN